MNNTWYLHSHFVWLRLPVSSIVKFPFVCLAAHVREFPRWTPLSVKLLLPPRHSRGVSLLTRPQSVFRTFQRRREPPTISATNAGKCAGSGVCRRESSLGRRKFLR